MKDVSFHEIIITKDDQRIVSTDASVYDALGSFAVRPMHEMIAIEDMEIYENNIKNCDGNFYPSKIICPDTMYYTYMKAEDNGNMIRLTVVNASDLLNAHNSLMRTISAFNVQLDLYDDVFFNYSPATDSVRVFNTKLADFDTGKYSLAEFENLLLKRTADDQVQAVKGFFAQVKSKVGRSSTVIEGNILNDDPGVTHTVLNESFVFYDRDSDGVVGNIQLKSNKDSIRPLAIKYDSLTGMIDKTDIIRIARERIDDRRLEGTALAIIDVDYFKSINDTYGHQYGDEVIKKVSDIIANEVAQDGLCGRFGGDEFLIVFYNIKEEAQLRSILKGIKSKVSSTFPDKGLDKDNPLSVSIGAAIFPNDADNYDDLFMLSDHCLYLAKYKGRNRYIIYTKDKHGSLESIKLKLQNSKKISERDLSYGDIIVKMFDMTLHDEDGTLEYYKSEFADVFNLQNVLLFVGKPFEFRCSAGSNVLNDESSVELAKSVLNSDAKEKYFSLGDFVVLNNLDTLPPHAHNIKKNLTKRGVYSLVIMRFYDKDNRECVLVMTSVGKKIDWNRSHYKYYRAFTDLLSLHSLS